MTYDARHIANWFIHHFKADGRTPTIMELLKLVYISHGWFLEINKRPLFNNQIEAWKFGPVIPDAYQAFRPQGVTIDKALDDYDVEIDGETASLLAEIMRIYGSMSASDLSRITHVKGGPWDVATRSYGYFAPMDNDLIQAHYEVKRAAATKKSA